MTKTSAKKLIVVTGPTATGKTRLAACAAARCNGEIISADSRQVFRGMDIGSGKDLSDYVVNGVEVPYHLVNIADPGYEYSVFEFQQDFWKMYSQIIKTGKQPFLCGGTGMYIESVLKGYRFTKAEVNTSLREKLQDYTHPQLEAILTNFRPLHNSTDTTDRARLIRAIEIEVAQKEAQTLPSDSHLFRPKIFALHFERPELRRRITQRLEQRLQNGMLEEISKLLSGGVKPEQLKFYGLEYRYATQYVAGEISYKQMFGALNTAIHQFSKRQMTWFRRMERQGMHIHWLDGTLPMEEKIDLVLEKL